MHRFALTLDLATGSSDIDGRLRALFGIANRILFASDLAEDVPQFRQAVTSLVSQLERHFAAEEAAMSGRAYLGWRLHAAFHHHVRSAARDIALRLGRDGLVEQARQAIFFMLEDWIVYHVTRADRELAEHLREQAPAVDLAPRPDSGLTPPIPGASTGSRWPGRPAARAGTT